MRVLIFDDDAAIGRLAVRIATALGMDAMAVTNAAAFAQSLRSHPPQVIVLDLQLADTEGEGLGLKVESVLEKPLRVAELEQVLEHLRSADQSLSAERVREAISNDELSLDFQPVVTRKPSALMKLEALIRWNHPVAGRIPPGAFLPVAEGDPVTIDALTEWVTCAAVRAY